MKKLALLGAMTLALTAPAWADTAPASAPAYVSAGPFYDLFVSYLVPALGVLIPALLTWGLAIFQQRTGIKLDAAAQATMQQATLNGAGRIIAALEPAAMNMKIDVRSQAIAAEVPKVLTYVGDAAKRLGYTPEHVAQQIQAKIGILQSGSAAAAVAVPPVVQQ